MTMLEIQDLTTVYRTEQGPLHAVEDVDLTVEPGETLGVVGESGSGKSTLVKSIMGVLPDNGEIRSGQIKFEGDDLTKLTQKQLRNYRWQKISMIPQSAMNALDPVYNVEDQIIEIMQSHQNTPKKKAREKAKELFEMVDLEPSRLTDYPHQFSGGMKQRAMIAISLVLDPQLVIADEPTTALDVITQRKVMDSIANIQQNVDVSMILVTHDISVVAERCEKIAVFYGGRVVEYGKTEEVIESPMHPYTIGLKNAFPSLFGDKQELTSIPGTPPVLYGESNKCNFSDRCPFAVDECLESRPKLRELRDGHYVECVRADERDVITQASDREIWRPQ